MLRRARLWLPRELQSGETILGVYASTDPSYFKFKNRRFWVPLVGGVLGGAIVHLLTGWSQVIMQSSGLGIAIGASFAIEQRTAPTEARPGGAYPVLAVTTARLLIVKQQLLGRVGVVGLSLPRSDIASIDVGRLGLGRRTTTLKFNNGRSLTLAIQKVREFRDHLRR